MWTPCCGTLRRAPTDILGPLQAFTELFGAPRAVPRSVEGDHQSFGVHRNATGVNPVRDSSRAGRNLTEAITWAALDERFKEEWQAYKQREAERNKKAEGGPNYYVVRRHRMGGALLGLVRRSLDEGTITHTKAGRVLGVKPRNVGPLLSMRGAS